MVVAADTDVNLGVIIIGALVLGWVYIGVWLAVQTVAVRRNLICRACFKWDVAGRSSPTCSRCGYPKQLTRDELRRRQEPVPDEAGRVQARGAGP